MQIIASDVDRPQLLKHQYYKTKKYIVTKPK